MGTSSIPDQKLIGEQLIDTHVIGSLVVDLQCLEGDVMSGLFEPCEKRLLEQHTNKVYVVETLNLKEVFLVEEHRVDEVLSVQAPAA
jgi:hypothetical protein